MGPEMSSATIARRDTSALDVPGAFPASPAEDEVPRGALSRRGSDDVPSDGSVDGPSDEDEYTHAAGPVQEQEQELGEKPARDDEGVDVDAGEKTQTQDCTQIQPEAPIPQGRRQPSPPSPPRAEEPTATTAAPASLPASTSTSSFTSSTSVCPPIIDSNRLSIPDADTNTNNKNTTTSFNPSQPRRRPSSSLGTGIHNGVAGAGSARPLDRHDSRLDRDRLDYDKHEQLVAMHASASTLDLNAPEQEPQQQRRRSGSSAYLHAHSSAASLPLSTQPSQNTLGQISSRPGHDAPNLAATSVDSLGSSSTSTTSSTSISSISSSSSPANPARSLYARAMQTLQAAESAVAAEQQQRQQQNQSQSTEKRRASADDHVQDGKGRGPRRNVYIVQDLASGGGSKGHRKASSSVWSLPAPPVSKFRERLAEGE